MYAQPVFVAPAVVTIGVNTPSQLSRPVKVGAVIVPGLHANEPLVAVVDITGAILSITVTTLLQVDWHPLPSVTVSVNVNVWLQFVPAFTETV